MNPAATPPRSEAELLERVRDLAGRTVGELGAALELSVPDDQRRAKGLVGRLVELWLGSDAGNRAEPDFRALGVELKTLPVDGAGKPRESTFVCSIDLGQIGEQAWPGSRACKKLARVLWVPVEAEPELPLPARRIGMGKLWSPDGAEEAQLRADWDEIATRIASGDVDQITAHLGTWLQVRPKAAHGGVRRRAFDDKGAPQHSQPRGFYLRTAFTRRLFP